MTYSEQVTEARAAALAGSVRLHAQPTVNFSIGGCLDLDTASPPLLDRVRDTAETLAAWILGTASVSLIRGQVVSQTTGQPTGTSNEGDPMQLHDDEKTSLTVDTKDARGFETADTVTWSIDDGSVASLTVSDDGRSCTVVAGSPGSATITVTDSDAGLTATEAIDVVPGGTAMISIVEGAVEKQ